jgi:AcrR family transcriptional regulator
MTSLERPVRGREAVVDALVDAAAGLFAARGTAATSVRDVARAAGVNHGLVHHYFGSKDALLGTVLDRLAERVSEGSGSRDVDLYMRVLARALLDGEDVATLQRARPTMERLVEQSIASGRSPAEARLEVARLVALDLGWRLFGPMIAESVGLSGDADALRRTVTAPVDPVDPVP